ncbi:MAG TPA: hypothetical protein VHA53_08920 [Nitrolancea sp.]|nr:hypothetical protein [Nitrolancea sp.]
MDSSAKQSDLQELLLELDRLEELREELEERGLQTLAELEARIEELSLQAEALESTDEPSAE